MKTCSILCSYLVVSMALALPLTCIRAADDIHVTYQEGRAAFFAGDYELAREKLSIVLAANPSHPETRAMMAQIKLKLGEDNTQLRKSYERVIIPKIEFSDVQLDEALTAVRILAKKASNDKVSPNLIVKNPDLGKKPVTLSLTNIPLSEVLNYLGQLVSAKVVYDKSAVIFANPAG